MSDAALPAVVEQPVADQAPPPLSFPELVYAHQRWRRAQRGANGDSAEAAFHAAVARFEQEHGRIVHAYWCSRIESAVALTERAVPRMFSVVAHPRLRFHRASDWATKGEPEVAAQLHRCDELAIRAEHVLTGLRRRVCMQLAMTAAAHVLSLVDDRSAHPDAAHTRSAVKQEKARLDEVEAYYREAANGQAQMVYFAGMAACAALLAGVGCVLWLALGHRDVLGPLIAGAIGAVVSVIQRINTGTFDVEYDVGRGYVFFLGALRPAIGAVFGLAISFAVTSGLLNLPVVGKGSEAKFAALLVVTFFAGFSERWAQDTLAASVPNAGKTKASPPHAPPLPPTA
jgi:hypothetical protein